MGLNSYFYASKYISGYKHNEEQPEYKEYFDIISRLELESVACKNTPSLEIKVTVAYWKKANQIHNWFVTNVQDGEDNCQISYVYKEQIQNLINDCEAVLKDHSLANITLPTGSGFFFGSTCYDEYYFEDLKETVKMLKPLLDLEGFGFYYHASW